MLHSSQRLCLNPCGDSYACSSAEEMAYPFLLRQTIGMRQSEVVQEFLPGLKPIVVRACVGKELDALVRGGRVP